MSNAGYTEKLLDPRWQKKRLEIFQRDNWQCQNCGNTKSTLHVHHQIYHRGVEVWDYPNSELTTLCDKCHTYAYERAIAENELVKAFKKFDDSELFDLVRTFKNISVKHDDDLTLVIMLILTDQHTYDQAHQSLNDEIDKAYHDMLSQLQPIG